MERPSICLKLAELPSQNSCDLYGAAGGKPLTAFPPEEEAEVSLVGAYPLAKKTYDVR